MEILAVIFVWPFIIFALGLAFVALSDASGHWFPSFSWLWVVLTLTVGYFILRNRRKAQKAEWTPQQQLTILRKGTVIISIALLLPVFTRYLFATLGNVFFAILLSLVLGFGFTLWGFFLKGNTVLKYSNV
ncbi:MAG: hypothetical protein HY397_03685, partial [Candidatus Doudnabacteria bacterium]|nr:hypothetical protein [Candidatus Doudnabacteria bacterium]